MHRAMHTTNDSLLKAYWPGVPDLSICINGHPYYCTLHHFLSWISVYYNNPMIICTLFSSKLKITSKFFSWIFSVYYNNPIIICTLFSSELKIKFKFFPWKFFVTKIYFKVSKRFIESHFQSVAISFRIKMMDLRNVATFYALHESPIHHFL